MSAARLFAALVLLVVASPRTAHAGPWLPGAWHFYLQLRQSVQYADTRFDAAGGLAPVRAVSPTGGLIPSSFEDSQTGLYLELGLATRLAITVDVVGLRAIWQPLPGAASRSAVGLSETTLGGKLLLFDDEVTAALVGRVGVPLGAATAAEPLTPGDVRADLALSVGRLFETVPIFVAGELGLRVRGSAEVLDPLTGHTIDVAYAPAILFAAQAGYTFAVHRPGCDRVIAIVDLEGRYGATTPVDDGRGSLAPPSERFVKLGAIIVYAPSTHIELHVAAGGFVWGEGLPLLVHGDAGVALKF